MPSTSASNVPQQPRFPNEIPIMERAHVVGYPTTCTLSELTVIFEILFSRQPFSGHDRGCEHDRDYDHGYDRGRGYGRDHDCGRE